MECMERIRWLMDQGYLVQQDLEGRMRALGESSHMIMKTLVLVDRGLNEVGDRQWRWTNWTQEWAQASMEATNELGRTLEATELRLVGLNANLAPSFAEINSYRQRAVDGFHRLEEEFMGLVQTGQQ